MDGAVIDSRDLRRDIDALEGAQSADRGQLRRPFLHRRRLSRNRRRLGRENRGDEAFDHLRLDEELKIIEAAANPAKHRQDEQKNDGPTHAQRQQAENQDEREKAGYDEKHGSRNGNAENGRAFRAADDGRKHNQRQKNPIHTADDPSTFKSDASLRLNF